MLNVLFVDDEVQLIQLYSVGLKNKFNISTAFSGKDALSVLRTQSIDVLVTDINMPEMTGCELAEQVKVEFPQMKIIAISANFKQKEHDTLFNSFLEKPVKFKTIEDAILAVT